MRLSPFRIRWLLSLPLWACFMLWLQAYLTHPKSPYPDDIQWTITSDNSYLRGSMSLPEFRQRLSHLHETHFSFAGFSYEQGFRFDASSPAPLHFQSGISFTDDKLLAHRVALRASACLLFCLHAQTPPRRFPPYAQPLPLLRLRSARSCHRPKLPRMWHSDCRPALRHLTTPSIQPLPLQHIHLPPTFPRRSPTIALTPPPISFTYLKNQYPLNPLRLYLPLKPREAPMRHKNQHQIKLFATHFHKSFSLFHNEPSRRPHPQGLSTISPHRKYPCRRINHREIRPHARKQNMHPCVKPVSAPQLWTIEEKLHRQPQQPKCR